MKALLSAPNPDDPLATDVAKHYKEDEKDAQKVSREWTEECASGLCGLQPSSLFAQASGNLVFG